MSCRYSLPTILTNLFNPRSPLASQTYSITLTGVATILSYGSEESEMLRELHTQNNPTSATFIRGEGIGVVVIDVLEARICDILDKVTTWKAGE